MSNTNQYDVAVIGAGPGGYVAAIKAAQMGKRVALIEKNHLGGTCLNVGCIPSKALLSHAALFKSIKTAETFGIHIDNVSFDYSKMKDRKDQVVTNIRNSLKGLLASNTITIIQGQAAFHSPKKLKVQGDNPCIIEAQSIIIATGSQSIDIPAFPCDHKRILNSTSALSLTKLPKSMAIIGGGYIGCEFASLFSEFDVAVTIIESLPSIIAQQGETLSKSLTASFVKKGIELKTNHTVKNIESFNDHIVIHFEKGEPLKVEQAMVAVGRNLNVTPLNLGKAGIKPCPKGSIPVNEKMETSVSGIYAIGDVTAISMLAHVASHQGIIAASNACGKSAKIHYHAIPSVIFTDPEIATVGINKEEANKKNLNVNVGKFPFQALGKAIATNHTEGFVEIISDKDTGEIYGACAIGHESSAIIAEMGLAMTNELTVECITETIHAHPTLPEAWLEASLIANKTPIHFPPAIKPKG